MRYSRCNGTAYVSVAGELDIATGPQLHLVAHAWLSEPTAIVIFDLSGITFCDAVGLQAIEEIIETFREAHATLRIVGISVELHRTLTRYAHATPTCQ
ncbi:STAS domain-containing protein [Streptomyces sp. NPDC086783]|uniref:STAS domain-containing protein n=1 Tax=Streptomyces sp. NPDC086783 TaxID=3365758 RepID=UPI00380DF063